MLACAQSYQFEPRAVHAAGKLPQIRALVFRWVVIHRVSAIDVRNCCSAFFGLGNLGRFGMALSAGRSKGHAKRQVSTL